MTNLEKILKKLKNKKMIAGIPMNASTVGAYLALTERDFGKKGVANLVALTTPKLIRALEALINDEPIFRQYINIPSEDVMLVCTRTDADVESFGI